MFDFGVASRSNLESAAACRMAFSASNMSFYSSCKCDDVPAVTRGACSLSGFAFQPEKDGATPFTPGFPASSPWVTSVGATQVRVFFSVRAIDPNPSRSTFFPNKCDVCALSGSLRKSGSFVRGGLT